MDILSKVDKKNNRKPASFQPLKNISMFDSTKDLNVTQVEQMFEDINKLAISAKTSENDLEKILFAMEPVFRKMCGRYQSWKLPYDDLLQICRVEIWQAILAYQPEKGDFENFCRYFVSRRLKSFIKVSVYREKHRIHFNAVSFDEPNDEIDQVKMAGARAVAPSAENIAIHKEAVQSITQRVKGSNLTDLESACMRIYYLDDLSDYKQITKRLGVHRKAVDNAMQRAKRKLRENVELQEIYEAIC